MSFLAVLSIVGGPVFVLVWCDQTMRVCATGQPGTKAIIEIGARVALAVRLNHESLDNRKRALTPRLSHCCNFLTHSQVNVMYVNDYKLKDICTGLHILEHYLHRYIFPALVILKHPG